mmetsp:Transcript_21963/g.61073  ORF Transcript_21963/g.61073 Transcript_21963/m.61073 type:complete len:214 (+) Transcript_21963:1755-2396(+)
MNLTANTPTVLETNVCVPVEGHCQAWIIVQWVAILHVSGLANTLVLGPTVISPFVIGSSEIDRFNVLGANHPKGKLDLVLDVWVHVDTKWVPQSVGPDLGANRILGGVAGDATLGICTPIRVFVTRGFGVRIVVGDGPILVQSNDGTMDVVEGISIFSFTRVSRGNVQLSIVSEGHSTTIMKTFVHGWTCFMKWNPTKKERKVIMRSTRHRRY